MIQIFELDNNNKEAEKLEKVDFRSEKEIENILEEKSVNSFWFSYYSEGGRTRIKIKMGTRPSELKIEIPDELGAEWDEKHKEVIIYISSKDMDMELMSKLLDKAYSYVK